MEKTLAIIIGIQGSGKSTFYENYLAENYVRINLDTLVTREKEWELVKECFEKGYSMAIDNTNPTKYDRQRYIPLALINGYKIIGYYMDSKLEDCIKRNNQRTGKEKIPLEAIRRTANKLQLPSYDENFDELYKVKNNGKEFLIEKWSKR